MSEKIGADGRGTGCCEFCGQQYLTRPTCCLRAKAEWDGGDAFPALVEWDPEKQVGVGSGMSLRDYFAAAALPALIRVATTTVNAGDALSERTRTDHKNKPFDWPDTWYYYGNEGKEAAEDVACDAYMIADAMIAERQKGREE